MNSIQNLIDPTICVRLTYTLLHFAWQGLVICLGAVLAAWVCRTATAKTRYGIHAVSLVLMVISVAMTFVLMTPPEPLLLAPINSEPTDRPTFAAPAVIENATSAVPVAEPLAELNTRTSWDIEDVHRATTNIAPTQPAVDPDLTSEKIGFQFEPVLRQFAPYAALAYLVGLLAMMVRLGCALWGGHRLRDSATLVDDQKFLAQVRRQAARIGLKFTPVVAYCERVTIPVVVGVLRPMILLPIWIATEMDPDQLLVILTHEMAHIRRFDLLVNLLQRFLETVLFFHPAVWHISRQLSFERESCCDDAVVHAGYGHLQYASTLVRLAELCAADRRTVPTTLLAALAASGGNGSQLKRRILRLLSNQTHLRLTRSDSLMLLLMAGLIAGTTAGLWRHAVGAPPNDSTKTANAADAQSDKDKQSHEKEFSGKVVDSNGNPIAGAEIWCTAPNPIVGYRESERTVRQFARCDAKGNFSFRYDTAAQAGYDNETWVNATCVIAKAPGYGCDLAPLEAFDMHPVATAKRAKLQQHLDKSNGQGWFASRTLKLPPEAGPVRGRLIDLEGQPLSGVVVSVDRVQSTNSADVDEAFAKSSVDLLHESLDSHSPGSWWLTRDDWREVIPPVKTDANGEFVLYGIGRDQMATVTLKAPRVAAERFFILGRDMQMKRLPHLNNSPGGAMDVYVGTNFIHAVGPAVPVSGVVTEFQSGKPIANAVVEVDRLFGREEINKPNELRLWTDHIRAVTDEQGRYELVGIPPGAAHELNVTPPKSEPWLMADQVFSVEPDQSEVTVNIQVFRGIWLEGRVTDEATEKPIKGRVDYLALRKNPNIPQRFGLHDAWKMDRFRIDESGRYRVIGLPGPGLLLVRSYGEAAYPLSVGADKVEGYEAGGRYLPTTPTGLPLSNWHRIEFIDPAVGAQSHSVDLTLSAGTSLTGRVVMADGSPASRIEALGQIEDDGFFDVQPSDRFSVHHYDSAVPRNLFFRTWDNSQVGYLHLEGTALTEITVHLQPAITAKGRLIETATDDAAAKYRIYCESTKNGDVRIDYAHTEDDGRFEIKGLMAGNVYEMGAANQQRFSTNKNKFTIDLTNAKPGEVIELGDVTGKNAKASKK